MRISALTLGIMMLASGPALAGEQKARIEVSGLWCSSCSYIAGEALQKSSGVEIIDFSRSRDGRTAVYTVTFDDAVVSAAEIAAQPVAVGFSTEVLSVGEENS